jgi:hypothetical protein
MKVLITVLLIIATTGLKAQWTKKDEVTIIVKTYDQGKTLGLTESQSIEFATCVISKMKIAIPNPSTSKMTADDAREIGKNIGLECLGNYKLKLSWSPQSEEMIKTYLNNIKEFNILTKEAKDKFSDCVISKLKQKYPNGFNKIPEEDAGKIGEQCMEIIIKQ